MADRPRINDSLGPRHSAEFASYVLDMLAPLGPVEMGRLFSGHGLKLDGVNFAMILRGIVFLRVDESLGAELAAQGGKPFRYGTKLGTRQIASYHGIPEDRLEDQDQVLAWARRAVAAAMANAAQKGKKGAKKKE